MGWPIVFLGWFSVVFFLLMAAYKFFKYATMPLHLRWELYPVAHEPNAYGGSYMEEVDYVRKPRRSALWKELKELLSEVFYLQRVKEHNTLGIWLFSLAMHWGIYIFFFWVFLLVVESFFALTGISLLINILGAVSFILGAFGSLGLFIKRISSEELSPYTAPVDYFNLLFLLAIFVTGLLSWLTDPSLVFARVYVENVLFLKLEYVPLLVLLNFILFELFLIYMPFTKLLHYVAKYFTFHNILWDDAVNIKGSSIDKRITAQLAYRATWSAPHMVPGKTWVEEVQIADGRDVENG